MARYSDERLWPRRTATSPTLRSGLRARLASRVAMLIAVLPAVVGYPSVGNLEVARAPRERLLAGEATQGCLGPEQAEAEMAIGGDRRQAAAGVPRTAQVVGDVLGTGLVVAQQGKLLLLRAAGLVPNGIAWLEHAPSMSRKLSRNVSRQ